MSIWQHGPVNPKLQRITGKEMIRFLEKNGFLLVRIRGSHHFLQKENFRTCVPLHGNSPLRVGTLRSILRDIEMSPKTFIDLLNL